MKSKFEKIGKILNREEMKNVRGGYNSPPAGGGGGTCCAHTSDWSEQACGISKAEAQETAKDWGYWCCNSCPH